ncbi:MAG: hypothetical protein M1834_009332 [Cirrosporium novae-zelandiae]|nr:MAG: hypothetical protein M1834_009332 [Cirrosporium novae-zelandiae]
MSFSRTGIRLLSSTTPRASTSAFRSTFLRQAKPIGRRYAATDSTATPAKRNIFQKLWDSPVGFKTVHFWAPVMKWALVLAGISDFYRPADKLSLTQNLALTATGTIWTRWCFVIRPQNMLLAAVNFFLACVGVTQCSRIFLYRYSQKNKRQPGTVDESLVQTK